MTLFQSLFVLLVTSLKQVGGLLVACVLSSRPFPLSTALTGEKGELEAEAATGGDSAGLLSLRWPAGYRRGRWTAELPCGCT